MRDSDIKKTKQYDIKQLLEDAKKLLSLKRRIAKDKDETRAIKNRMGPKIEQADQLIMPNGKISFRRKRVARSLDRSKSLQFISEICGPEIARALDDECTVTTYVTKSLHVKTWGNDKD